MSLSEDQIRELSELASAATDERMDPAALGRLEIMLAESEEARRFYVRFMALSSGLSAAALDLQSWISVREKMHRISSRKSVPLRRELAS